MQTNLYCVSYKRAHTLPEMDSFIRENAIFCIWKEEEEEYKKYGAKKFIFGKGLLDQRNQALQHAYEENANCVQIDDDLVEVRINNFDGKKGDLVSFEEAYNDFISFAENSKAQLIGMPPTNNPFFAKKEVQNNAFCIASFMLAKPTSLRFDENLSLKEDYDYTLQHIKEYGLVQRYQKYLFTFRHYSNTGGVVDYRNDELENKNMMYLLKKWGGALKMHPKRKNEVLFQRSLQKYL